MIQKQRRRMETLEKVDREAEKTGSKLSLEKQTSIVECLIFS